MSAASFVGDKKILSLINFSLSLSSINPELLDSGNTSLLNPKTKTTFLFSTFAKSIVDIIIELLISGIERYLIDVNPVLNSVTNFLYSNFSLPKFSFISLIYSRIFL